MDDRNFVYGDEKRIFVNTDLGCDAKCKYCYLPSLEIKHGERKITASRAIEMVNNLGCYTSGNKGSIISLGCYSECMDTDNISDTIALIKYFVARNNNVQLATKKKIDVTFFEEIVHYNDIKRLLWIYVSLPTISCHDEIEPGTDLPDDRTTIFELCKEYGIHSVLYIKPFLTGITNRDIGRYNELICKYDIPVVIGELLNTKQTSKCSMIGGGRLYEQSDEELEEFIAQISKYARTYKHSVDCIRP